MLYYDKNKVYISEELYYTIYRIKRRVILAPCDELKKKQQYIKRAIMVFNTRLRVHVNIKLRKIG